MTKKNITAEKVNKLDDRSAEIIQSIPQRNLKRNKSSSITIKTIAKNSHYHSTRKKEETVMKKHLLKR